MISEAEFRTVVEKAFRWLLRRAARLVQAAGFTDVRAGSSTWTFADPESRAWWGGL